ncbi:MAG: hypothetical protein QOI95_2877 [Acidimicrobiaceae bacterium]|jgi:hypothetical protein
MKRIILIAATVLLAACGGGGGGGSATRTLTGDVTLYDLDMISDQVGGPCTGQGGFNDLRDGAPVVVKDGAGKIVATGQLGAGKRIGVNGATTVSTECRFPVTVSGIPASDFYQVEVSRRGAQTYSLADLETATWQVHLTIGK